MKGKIILRGLVASKGKVQLVVGKVRKINGDPAKANSIQPGEILVAEHTDPTMVPGMRKAGAIITNTGGLSSHAAIVAREFGIPCITKTGTATQLLQEGQEIVVDTSNPLTPQGQVDVSGGLIHESLPGPGAAPAAPAAPKPGGSIAERMAALAKAQGIALPSGFIAQQKKKEG